MTAANLGARVTGWGFVVFTAGSICWSIVGLSTGQINLVLTNAFLTLVNILGVWRWLGRQAHYEEGARDAVAESEASAAPTLLDAGRLAGMPVHGLDGDIVGKGVETMLECGTGRVAYLVVSSGGVGGIGERLVAVPLGDMRLSGERVDLRLTAAQFARLPTWSPAGD